MEKPSTVTARVSQKKMKKMYVFFDDDFVYFSSKWHLSTSVFQLPPQTISVGHLLHQVCQLLESGPVNDFPVHAQRIEIHSFAGQVLRLHRLRLAQPDILALLLLGAQSFRHVEREGAPCSAFDNDSLQAFINAFKTLFR